MATHELIFVLGMGRSGTSALTKVLALCGGQLPVDLIAANPTNERGHYEPAQAVALNERFLGQFGLTWYDPTLRLQNDIVVEDGRRETFVAGIAAFLRANADRSPLVVKDPRIAGLSPFWFEAARREGWTMKIVIPVRHPIEVARSLAVRDGITQDFSFSLWLKYMLLAEQASRGMPRVFVGYARLMDDWARQVRRVADALDLRLDHESTTAIDDFLDTDMRHHRVDDDAPIDNIWVRTIHAQLAAACDDVGPDLDMLDRLRELYFASEGQLRRTADELRECHPPVVVARPATLTPAIPPIVHALITGFNETGYLARHADVRQAVENGSYTSGLEHWLAFGYAEGRSST